MIKKGVSSEGKKKSQVSFGFKSKKATKKEEEFSGD